MLAIINACLLVFSSHLYVVISFISHGLCIQPLFSVVPMNSSFSPFLKPQIPFLKGGLMERVWAWKSELKMGA